jgi:hypothetical protein
MERYCSGGTEENRCEVQSGVDIATSYGRPIGIFLVSKTSRQVMGPTEPPVQWTFEVLPGGRRSESKVDHSPPVVRRSRMRRGRPTHPLQPCMAWIGTGTFLCFSVYRVDIINQLKHNQELILESWQLELVRAVLADTSRYKKVAPTPFVRCHSPT